MDRIKNEVYKLVIAHAKVGKGTELKDTDDLIYDLGMDSLSLVELIVDLESMFDFEVDEECVDQIYKYGKLVKYVKNSVENNVD